MNPRDHVEAICKDYTANPRVQDALQGAMRHVQRSFSRRGHLLMEFIQNAEDARAPKMQVVLDPQSVKVCNKGRVFTSGDVDSICKIGRSTKNAEEYIGYLGVGFKSTFLLADKVAVHSGDYHFAFDSSAWPSNSPWQIMPVWQEPPSGQEWQTVFNLDKLHAQAATALKDSFASFQPRTLLWLDYLTQLTIADGSHITEYVKTPVEPGVWRVTTTEDYNVVADETWLIMHKKCAVPPDVSADDVTKDWEREEVKNRRVAAAFRMDKGNLIEEPKGTVYLTIYSYTPLKDESVPIHFLMQGDFLTSPNRESIHREAAWNKWLAKQLLELLRDICIPAFLQKPEWSGRFQSILNVAETGNHPIWDDLVRKPLEHHLVTEPVFPAADGSLITFSQCIRVPSGMKGLIGDEEIAILEPGKKRVADHVDYEVELAPGNSTDLIRHAQANLLLAAKAGNHDSDWFVKLYLGMKSHLPLSNYYKGQLKYGTPFLLTGSYGLSAIDAAYTNPGQLAVPPEISKEFNVLHSSLTSGQDAVDVQAVLTGLGVRELSEDAIRKALVRTQIPEIEGKWSSLTEAERVYWIKLFVQYSIDPKQLAFVTLPTRKPGTWLSPKAIIFATEYHPEPDVEKLMTVGLLDAADVPEPVLEPVLLNQPQGPSSIGTLIALLQSLGVGQALTQTRLTGLAQRVATKASIAYEKAMKRNATELPESESHIKGYDIISSSPGDTRLIEAKGRRTANEEITITHNQWKALTLDPDQYYVYVVTDALSADPLIHPIKGKSLQNVDNSLRIQHAIWKSASEPPARFSTLP